MTEPWAMRGCSHPGCKAYARAECHAFDNTLQRPCRVPLCDLHRGRHGKYNFCVRHRSPVESTGESSPTIQTGLFDSPDF